MISEFILLTLAGGIALSFLLVDPPNRIHPVSWFGKLVSYFIPKLKHKSSPKEEKLKGIIFALILTLGMLCGDSWNDKIIASSTKKICKRYNN